MKEESFPYISTLLSVNQPQNLFHSNTPISIIFSFCMNFGKIINERTLDLSNEDQVKRIAEMSPFFISTHICATSYFERAQQEKNSGIERSVAISFYRGQMSAEGCQVLAFQLCPLSHITVSPVQCFSLGNSDLFVFV